MVTAVKMTRREADALIDRALRAGAEASRAAKPAPMIVAEEKIGGKAWFVDEGPCGFAWVIVKPARGILAKRLKERDLAKKSCRGGLMWWIFGGGQSIARKEAAAHAIVKVLREAGVHAYAASRLD